jgi:hypothetical protein
MSGEVWAVHSQRSRGNKELTYQILVEPAMLNELEDEVDKSCYAKSGDQREIGDTEHDS